jgi:hypothetical protein
MGTEGGRFLIISTSPRDRHQTSYLAGASYLNGPIVAFVTLPIVDRQAELEGLMDGMARSLSGNGGMVK